MKRTGQLCITLLSLLCVNALSLQIRNETGSALSCVKVADPSIRHCGIQIPNHATRTIRLRPTPRYVVMLHTQSVWPAKINIVKKSGLLSRTYCYPTTFYHCQFNGSQQVTIKPN